MKNGLPGLRGTEHIGFTVPNLDEAVDFFVRIIGCEPFYELGPFQSNGDWMQTQLNLHPRAVMKRLKFLRCGNGSNFEIFEYSAPDQRLEQPKNSDIGGHHVALYVDDMDAAIEHLREHGVEIMGEPTASKQAAEGQRWLYFRSPWGLQFELVSFPAGKAYETDAPVKLWHPAHPAE